MNALQDTAHLLLRLYYLLCIFTVGAAANGCCLWLLPADSSAWGAVASLPCALLLSKRLCYYLALAAIVSTSIGLIAKAALVLSELTGAGIGLVVSAFAGAPHCCYKSTRTCCVALWAMLAAIKVWIAAAATPLRLTCWTAAAGKTLLSAGNTKAATTRSPTTPSDPKEPNCGNRTSSSQMPTGRRLSKSAKRQARQKAKREAEAARARAGRGFVHS